MDINNLTVEDITKLKTEAIVHGNEEEVKAEKAL